jgi:hypothetical protein
MLCLLASAISVGSAFADETPVNGSAKGIWGERAQGKTYRIAEDVKSDGLYRTYVLETREGKFTIEGDALMALRLHEYAVYEQLSEDTGIGHFIQSFGASAVAPLKFGGQLIVSPLETTKQSFQGIGNFFDSMSASSENKDSERGSFMGGVLGTDAARRDLASQAGVDPYTDFPPLAKRLQELAAARGVGGLSLRGAMMAIPGGAALPSMTATTTRTVMFSASSVGAAQGLQEALRTKTAGQIMRDCRVKLLALGAEAQSVEALLTNPNYTPADLLVIATALERAGAKGADLFVVNSATATDRATAYLHRQQAEMYAGLRRSFTFERFVVKEGYVLATLKDQRLLMALPADHFFWTEKNRQEISAMGPAPAPVKPGAKPVSAKKDKLIVITGDYAKRDSAELAKLNWEPARMTLTPPAAPKPPPAPAEEAAPTP